MNRIIMHVDMNSYFASVSQQFTPELQGRPVAVMGKGKGTVVIAASKEAKIYGVKTGTIRREAEILAPGIVFVEPNFAAYVHVTSKLMNIFHEFTPLVEPFSIDEAFLDVTETYDIRKNNSPIELAYKIKKRIRKELGDIITCSVGIADNKLMAKLASDMKKPDGLVYLTPDQYQDVLDNCELMDICGIGRNIYAHLEKLKIKTIRDLRKVNYKILEREFGRVEGRFLYHAARGESFSKVDPSKYILDPKSVSHGETFTENKTGVDLYSNIYKLCEKVSLRLRKKSLFSKSVSIYIKDNNFQGYNFFTNFSYPTNNTMDIFEAIIKNIPKDFVSRFVCVYATNLSRSRVVDLFMEIDKKDYLQKAMDKINHKYGQFTLLPASILKPEKKAENNIEIPFSGFDVDAKTGIDLTTMLRKDLDIIKHRILHS